MNKKLYQQMLLLTVLAVLDLAYCNNTTMNTLICNDLTALDGSNYNLQTLIEKGKLQFPVPNTVVSVNSYVVTVSLCSNEDCFGSTAAACMCLKSGNKCVSTYSFGDFTPASINALDDGAGVEFNYKNLRYWTKLTLLCDYNFIGADQYTAVIQRNKENFLEGVTITVRTDAACPIKVPVSGGTIFMLVVLCLAVLYLVCGVMYNKFSLMKGGREVVPHSDFWCDLPALTKEGAAYAFSICRRQSPRSYENA